MAKYISYALIKKDPEDKDGAKFTIMQCILHKYPDIVYLASAEEGLVLTKYCRKPTRKLLVLITYNKPTDYNKVAEDYPGFFISPVKMFWFNAFQFIQKDKSAFFHQAGDKLKAIEQKIN